MSRLCGACAARYVRLRSPLLTPALLPCVSSLPHRLPTRVRMEYLDDGTAVRVAARSGAIIERPSILMERRNPRRAAGLMDTAASDVVLETNDGAHPRLKQF